MRFVRLLLLGSLLVFPLVAACPTGLTAITDTLYKADANKHKGSLHISWDAFTGADGHLVFSGSLDVPIITGVVSVCLEPNDTSSPSGMTYRTEYRITGEQVRVEYWSIPTTGSTLRIGDVRLITGPGQPMALPWPVTLGGTGGITPSAARANLGAAASGANTDITSITALMKGPSPYADIRAYGAVCDGTDQNTAVQAALTAGATHLYIPPGCHWIAPSGLIPAGLWIEGGSWTTSVILSASDPTTLPLRYGAGTKLMNLNLRGQTVNSPTDCPIFMKINASTITRNIVSTCYEALGTDSGQDNVDRTGTFFQVGVFPTGQTGDALNVSNSTGNSGNSIRADNYSGNGRSAILATAMPGSSTGSAVIQATNYAGAGVSPIFLAMYDMYRENGALIQANHRTSTYSGNAIELDMADVSGTFNGNFLSLSNAATTRFSVGSTGLIGTYGGTTTAGRGVVTIQSTQNHVDQSSSIASGNLSATVPAGFYRVAMYFHVKTPSVGACTASADVTWTYNGAAKTRAMLGGFDVSVDENYNIGGAYFKSDASSNILRSVTISGASCGSLVYDVTFIVERMD